MYIDFHDVTNSVESDYIDVIQRLITFAASKEGVTQQAEVSINFVNNKEIQELNRNYRQKNTPTDVLSFPMQELGEGEEEVNILDEDLPILLGDIVISVDKAKEQAEAYHHSLERELTFLALHGFLHLLGYDHLSEEDEKRMFSRQDEILGAFGIER
ncbi:MULTISPECIES: rRNA maturation RNase YbeY [Virgibacillus]|uniref:Endoribonuclease YbeY n=1 Tax=Virgibacillus pantothenticus TaxID=1473 RepID=A0A0L0QPJ6_VIRPA|nr:MULTISPECIES: rRNA maturation RNase YbeY [Virgibacillus]API90570.1 rRNA maturation RNase YbeY [Virgibacillus sp. 6R]KNE20525.1 rRNA maturation factor [Virgibacillus pantothenticus]MBS7429683.1 rRNA maturation RNase YbeY [Virgibacillus sp. 19R1-5]MBU8565558.1 rRNA maturation RNase YbeY [Virgibacillus pantothenticus]MBU8599856.1 rRNA maturation RNase YbeY [Virgibacillus pantothenticus]